MPMALLVLSFRAALRPWRCRPSAPRAGAVLRCGGGGSTVGRRGGFLPGVVRERDMSSLDGAHVLHQRFVVPRRTYSAACDGPLAVRER
uniref:Secreted protein n=1 Tax=Arundo donax TaxID=35708 RepID=A0A0A9BW85_ARUDO